MVKRKNLATLTWALVAFLIFGLGILVEAGQCQEPSPSSLPVGVWIELNKDFYDAMNQAGGHSTRTYSNDLQQEYLRQTSVASRFCVRTNIEILRSQERIIQLLESILKELQQQKKK